MSSDNSHYIEQWMPLAVWYARRHFTEDTRFDFEERKSVAFLALVKAANKFDAAKGFSFGSYAGMVIWRDLRKESYRAGSQMKRPSLSKPRPELELRQHSLGYHAELHNVHEEEDWLDHRDHVEWIISQLDDQQKAVALGIMENKTSSEIDLPRIKGTGKATDCRVGYVKKSMVQLIKSKELDELLKFVVKRVSDADLCDNAEDTIQDP